MEENNLSTGLESTNPETETGEATELTVNEAEPQAETSGGEDVQAKQDTDVTEETDSQQSSEKSESEESDEPSFTVRYNHEDKKLTVSEARRYAQLGMKYEQTKGLYDRLDYGAALAGVSVDKFVENAIMKPEEEHRKHLVEMYGEDSEDVEIGMNIFRAKQKADYQKIIDDRKANEDKAAKKEKTDTLSRLADEYLELKAEIPDIADYNDLPDSVIKEAASGKRDLLSAYLRYERKEKAKIEAAQKTEKAASTATAGGKSSEADDNRSSFDEFTAGLWGR